MNFRQKKPTNNVGFLMWLREQDLNRIHHLLWPNEIAKKMWPFLQGMLNNMIYDATVGGAKDYVIEGEASLPELISPLVEKYPKSIKAIFIGYTDVNIDHKMAHIKQYSHSQND
jgi:hypothetical protein